MGKRLMLAAAALVTLHVAACGGKVVFEEPGNGGSGDGGDPTSNTNSAITSTTPTTNSGPSGCTDHANCSFDQVCLFGTGECVPACGFDLPCPDGFACNDCGTSSCPSCLDCLGACFPAAPVQCDEHLDCGMSIGDDVCVFFSGTCAQRCGAGSPPCPPGLGCDDCATSSCPACDDCIGACVVLFE